MQGRIVHSSRLYEQNVILVTHSNDASQDSRYMEYHSPSTLK